MDYDQTPRAKAAKEHCMNLNINIYFMFLVQPLPKNQNIEKVLPGQTGTVKGNAKTKTHLMEESPTLLWKT